MQPHCPRQTQTTKDHLISRNCKTYTYKIKQYLILMLPILSSSTIIYRLRDTLLNIKYLSFLKPLKKRYFLIELRK